MDGRAGALGEVGDAADVVVVRVRDEDRGAARAQPGELEPKLRGVAARVDDDRFGRRAGRTDDVAVRADGAELVAVDGEASRRR